VNPAIFFASVVNKSDIDRQLDPPLGAIHRAGDKVGLHSISNNYTKFRTVTSSTLSVERGSLKRKVEYNFNHPYRVCNAKVVGCSLISFLGKFEV